MNRPDTQALQGGLLALLAACLFGASTPLVQLLGAGLGPFTTAALLYAGAAATGLLLKKPAAQEARLLRGDAWRLVLMAALGAVAGPVALAWGLQRTSGTSASLMLTLEALATAVLARAMYGESMGRRAWLAMTLLLAGGGLLVLEQHQRGAVQVAGLVAVLIATVAWGADNTVSRALADRDPGQVVLAKALLGSMAACALAAGMREPWPGWPAWLALLAVGAAGYGLSLRFYLLAQRRFGAARTGSVFAFAPFVGAAAAFALGDRSGSSLLACAGLVMLAGVWLHLSEVHRHDHEHQAMRHEHAHSHDDGHHGHSHEPMVTSPHSHEHVHEPLRHAHEHGPDAHHSHRH